MTAAVIYRKSDGAVVFPIAPGQPDRGLVEVERNVVPNYGGDAEDYARLDLTAAEWDQLTGWDGSTVRVQDGALTGQAPAPAEPEPDADAELVAAITAATTLQQLKDALIGKDRAAAVAGRGKPAG